MFLILKTEENTMNLGVDFGSTYSLVSKFDSDNGGLQCINLSVGSPYIPSVVSYNTSTGWYEYGEAAVGNIHLKDEKIYTTFKTLLNPNITEIKVEREYDNEKTPEYISYIFWSKIFNKLKRDFGVQYIENLVVGIPELWGTQFCVNNGSNKKLSAAEGRKAVERIFKKFDFIGNLKIVSEPQAATAYFAYNYNKNRNKNLEGYVLLIDYGGGTLDITLSEVASLKNGKTSVKTIHSDGEGENSGKLGSAGVLYMESLISRAMKDSGIQDIEYNHSFLSVRQELEKQLRTRTDYIETIFDQYINHPNKLKEKNLMSGLEYKKSDSGSSEKFDINFFQMYDVYNKVIYGTLDKMLDKFMPYIERCNKPLKIGLVGGFGNYYLVQKQVRDKFNISTVDDPRISGLLSNPEDREKAISLGCSVIANDLITICETFDFAMGAYEKIGGKIFYNYGIRLRDEIKYNTIYYSKDQKGKPYIFRRVSGSIDMLLINLSDDNRNAFGVKPKNSWKLNKIITNTQRTYMLGFSIDYDKVIHIHVQPVDHIKKTPIGEPIDIPMADFDNMFETEIL